VAFCNNKCGCGDDCGRQDDHGGRCDCQDVGCYLRPKNLSGEAAALAARLTGPHVWPAPVGAPIAGSEADVVSSPRKKALPMSSKSSKSLKSSKPKPKKPNETPPAQEGGLKRPGSYCPHCGTIFSTPVYGDGVRNWQRSFEPHDAYDRRSEQVTWVEIPHASMGECVSKLRGEIETLKANVESLMEWRRR
jgi:hypothetical protein